MRNHNLIALLACCLVSTQAAAAKPSFKCVKDAHEIEMLICQNDELAKLDVEMDKLYKSVLKNTPANRQKELKTHQIEWVKDKNDCWKDQDQVACTRKSYKDRMQELKELSGNGGGQAKGAAFKDLAGGTTASADDRLTQRGFAGVDSFETGKTQYKIFYNRKTRQCVQLTLANAKVESADDIKTHPKCR